MAPPQISTVLFVYCSFLIIYGNFATANVDTKKLYTICSGTLYDGFFDVLYDSALGITLSEMIKNTPKAELHEYYHKELVYVADSSYIYSHGQCTGTLPEDECGLCLHEAANQMRGECTHSKGAQTQLMDCRMRYEDYYFHNDG